MKNRRCVTLVLSSLLTLPGFAQQSSQSANPLSASSTDQNAVGQRETATGQPPLQAQPHDFWQGDEPGLFWLVMHPYASKAYVRRELQAVQARVDELNELSASNGKMVRDVDTRAQQGIQLASAKADMADQHAGDAAGKAQMAQQAAVAANTHVAADETMVSNIDHYNSASQTEIRFRPGQSALSKQAKNALDEIAAQLKDQHRYLIEVQGFSSGQGQAAVTNSRMMAAAVERYLVLNHEVPTYRIYVIGMGNAPAATRSGRSRVEVSVLKSDLEQTAKQ